VHITPDGRYLMTGDLFELKPGGFTNVTESLRETLRIEALAKVDEKELVVFPAKGTEKGSVYVFTDTSCGYCVRFHHDIPELNERGITVKYLAWPRAGLNSEPGNTMVNVWCSQDRNQAMNLAKNNQPVPQPQGDCSSLIIEKQIQLGHEMGVNGTPAVFLKNGRKVGGYLPPDRLAQALGI
jgi:thiol:disulfide interchange protein DsbC